ncbi:hypothetical protein DPMN_170486 [Dreissena polymorpha]|uniref:Uncharacterized protein n=1 Tax=Dreissena polymorpha TaxID=45954 RepID=A0A9D4IEB3_DREPO|nr:hypothetical protein DPMN_170486 [Dreissena polymorpha]
MPGSTGLQVLHPQGVDISRDASESCKKTIQEGQCQQQQNSRERSPWCSGYGVRLAIGRSRVRSPLWERSLDPP